MFLSENRYPPSPSQGHAFPEHALDNERAGTVPGTVPTDDRDRRSAPQAIRSSCRGGTSAAPTRLAALWRWPRTRSGRWPAARLRWQGRRWVPPPARSGLRRARSDHIGARSSARPCRRSPPSRRRRHRPGRHVVEHRRAESPPHSQLGRRGGVRHIVGGDLQAQAGRGQSGRRDREDGAQAHAPMGSAGAPTYLCADYRNRVPLGRAWLTTQSPSSCG